MGRKVLGPGAAVSRTAGELRFLGALAAAGGRTANVRSKWVTWCAGRWCTPWTRGVWRRAEQARPQRGEDICARTEPLLQGHSRVLHNDTRLSKWHNSLGSICIHPEILCLLKGLFYSWLIRWITPRYEVLPWTRIKCIEATTGWRFCFKRSFAC